MSKDGKCGVNIYLNGTHKVPLTIFEDHKIRLNVTQLQAN